MKKLILASVIASLLPLQSFAQSKLSAGEIDAILNESKPSICANLATSKENLKAQVLELKKLEQELEEAKQSNDKYQAAKTIQSTGFIVIAISASVFTLVSLANKFKYGRFFFETSGLLPQIYSFLGIIGGTITLLAGMGTEALTNDQIEKLQSQLSIVSSEAAKLNSALKNCKQGS